jgi:hypothetical protein
MPNKPRVYIDSCYYIDVAKGRLSRTLDQGRDLHIPFVEKLLLAALNDDIEVWASTFIIAECLAVEKGDMDVPADVRDTFSRLLASGNPVKIQAVDVFIAERARDLRWRDQIKCGGGADSIHVATALELGCEEFISTNVKRGPLNADAAVKLAKLGLRVIEAPQTSVLPPHYIKPLLDETGA